MKNIYYILIFLILNIKINAQNCGSDFLKEVKQFSIEQQKQILRNDSILKQKVANYKPTRSTIKIPVIFHVLWNQPIEKITRQQIESQIIATNKDLKALNLDIGNVPSYFSSVLGNPNIELVLANVNPNNSPTDGINYYATNKTSFDNAINEPQQVGLGGVNPWDISNYLNVWVVPKITLNGTGNWGGFGSFASWLPSNAPFDGIVMDCGYIGTMGYLKNQSAYNLGRSFTHEVGHYLNLHHIWGDVSQECTEDDGCNDTPMQFNKSIGTLTGIITDNCTSTGNGIMYMNHMDYTNDQSRIMFTQNQVSIMRACFDIGGPRNSLLTSPGYQVFPQIGKWVTPVGPYGNVSAIDVDANDSRWVALTGAVFNKEYGSPTNLSTANGLLVNNTAFDITHDTSGNIWIATGGGLTKYNHTSSVTYTNATAVITLPNLTNSLISNVFGDSKGNVWFAQNGLPLMKYNGISTVSYPAVINTFLVREDIEGNIWIGTSDGKLLKHDGVNFTLINNFATSAYPSNSIRAIAFGPDGKVHVGTFNTGYHVYDGFTFTNYNTSNSALPNNIIRGIVVDKYNQVYLGTFGGGLCKIYKNKFTIYNTNNSPLKSNNIRCLAQTKDGNVMIGSNGGSPNSGMYELIVEAPEVANISDVEYWFDTAYAKRFGYFIQQNDEYYLDKIKNLEIITTGNHDVNFRTIDEFGNSSSVVTSAFNRISVTEKIYKEPKLYINKSYAEIGENLLIQGADFYPGGSMNLYMHTSNGDVKPLNGAFIDLLGNWFLNVTIDNTFNNGEYEIFAEDLTSNKSANNLTFWVNNPKNAILNITSPTANTEIELFETVNIYWNDFVENVNANLAAMVTKNYRIEVSIDNGISWAIVTAGVTFNNCIPNVYNKNFYYNYQTMQLGNHIFRITDIENLANASISEVLNVKPISIFTYKHSLEWDKSKDYLMPTYENKPLPIKPIGVAAEGVSRVIVQLQKQNTVTKYLTNIDAVLSSSDGYIKSNLLGKIMLATNVSNYNLEANTTNNTSLNVPISTILNTYSFWYVSPDDFSNNINDVRNERVVTIKFNLTFSDASTELMEQKIIVVRPPLLFVHGLNGSANTFIESKYEVNNIVYKFDGKKENLNNSTLWKVIKRVELQNDASYDLNATILLDIYNGSASHPNSINGVIEQMHELAIACNQVDYVCHSMGGDIARTIINKYPTAYRPTIASSWPLKNYDKGFFHKLITINTPHNGSPCADILNFSLNNISWKVVATMNGVAEALRPWYGGFFNRRQSVFFNDASDAIKNLQTTGGVKFYQTNNVKVHFIGGSVFGTDDDVTSLPNNNVQVGAGAMVDFASSFIPDLVPYESKHQKVDRYVTQKFGSSFLLPNSDLIVPSTSQFPSLTLSSIPSINKNSLSNYPASVFKNPLGFHVTVTDQLEVGNQIFHLLNDTISSNNFTDFINADPNPNGVHYKKSRSILDSTIYNIDTARVKIISPAPNSVIAVDSTLEVIINIKDTINYLNSKIFVQGKSYLLNSKINLQKLKVKIYPTVLHRNFITVNSLYDSIGFKVYHVDTVLVNIKIIDSVQKIVLSKKTFDINKRQVVNIKLNAITAIQSYVLDVNKDSVAYSIADTNVVMFNVAYNDFTTKDSGSTYIVFNYKGFSDTAFVYVAKQNGLATPLAINSIQLSANSLNCSNLLQWSANLKDATSYKIQKSINGIAFTTVAIVDKNCNKYVDNYIDKNDKYIYNIVALNATNKALLTSNTCIVQNICKGLSATTIYPNPAQKELNVILGNQYTKLKHISIIASNGQIVKRIELPQTLESIITIDVDELAKGAYILQLNYQSNISEQLKFIKN